jgi:hypothetical protein
MRRPRLGGHPDFWPVAIVIAGGAALAISTGDDVIPTLLIAIAALTLWGLFISSR